MLEVEKNHSGIYVIMHIPSGKMYIGQSKCILTRWESHKYQLKTKKHYNKELQKVWNSSKESDWLFEVLESCSEEALDFREQYYINLIGINALFNKAWSVGYIPRKKSWQKRKRKKLQKK